MKAIKDSGIIIIIIIIIITIVHSDINITLNSLITIVLNEKPFWPLALLPLLLLLLLLLKLLLLLELSLTLLSNLILI